MSVRSAARVCTLFTLGTLLLGLTGCALSGGPIAGGGNTTTGGVAPGSPTAKAGLGGTVYGGQSPISGATVTLWAAGTSATYGTGATSIATAATDSNGNFSFNVGGVSPCTIGQYLYITSVGGDTGAGFNTYAAVMAALPSACNSSTANSFVIVNEVTTVASVTALQQFMNIAPGGTPAWTIGAPAANITGLANAFTQVGNLVSIATGTSAPTTATATINNGTTNITYTNTITPDSNKIYTLADVLAACINTSGSSRCNSLFTDSTPTGSASPTDTIQVAYYLATNTAGLTMPAHGDPGSPSYLCSQYVDAQSPFPPTTACNVTTTGTYPTDWAIGVSWSTSNGSAVVGTANAYNVAIDGSGNVWTAVGCTSSCTTSANITEFNPSGQVLFTPVNSTTITAGPTTQFNGGTNGGTALVYSPNFTSVLTGTAPVSETLLAGRPFSLAIDTNNNAWFDPTNSAQPASSVADSGVIVEVAPGGTPTGYLVPGLAPAALSIDGSNNLYFEDAPLGLQSTSARYYTSELEFSNTSHPGNYAVYDAGLDRQTQPQYAVWADNLGYAWSVAIAGKCTAPGTIYRGNTAEFEADGALGVSVDDVTNASACPYWNGFPDGTGGAYFTQGGSGSSSTYSALGLSHLTVAGSSGSRTGVIVTTAAGTGATNGGLDSAAGTIVDGQGNIWVANTAGGVSEFSFATGAFVPLSPSGTATSPVYGFGSSSLTGKTPYGVAADSSGNLWIGSGDATTLHYLVGIAGPVVTPISAMLKASFIGERPGAQTLVSLSPALNISTLVPSGGSQTATLTNTGSSVVKISGTSIGGTTPADFTVSGTTCASTLAIGANCTITVTFTSSTAGTFSAALNVASNAVGSPASVSLTGTASTAVPLSLQAGTSTAPSVPSITFASMVAGSASANQAVAVTNSGAVPLTLSIGVTGTGANLFPESTTCGSSLAAGASCNIVVAFAPKVAGSYSAAINLTDNAGSGSQSVSLSGAATPFTISINTSNASAWVIDNGAITFNWNSASAYLNSWVLDGYSDQLVDTTTLGSGSQIEGLYSGMVGPFMNGTPTSSCTMVGAVIVGTPTTTCTTGSGSTPYLDWAITWLDTASPTLNDYTFVWHYVVFPNDPGVHTYVQLVHNASNNNPVTNSGIGQIQWIFRDNQSIFTHTYEVNSGLNWLGAEDIPLPVLSELNTADPGRQVQNAAADLHGFTDLPAGFGREFITKYDYAGFEYLHQAHGLYGPAASGVTYGVWTVLPKLETFVGGPTKQDLWFTENIDMIEAQSNHELNQFNMSTGPGVASNRLFGPYYIHINTLGQAYNQGGNALASQADMYADAISAEAGLVNQYDNVAPLVAAGYVASTGRGSVSIQMNNVIGAPHTAWAVLSDPNTNFQYTNQGMQYWADISQNGTATITGVAPGTYRLSVYVLGQWGEYRQDGIVVTANNPTTVAAATFVPETFTNVNGTASGETVFTIGTADRSSHEFLHGHNTTTGNDDREFWGNWNYWQDFQANQGAVVYYATAVGSIPATNDLTKWNYVHWGSGSYVPGTNPPTTATGSGSFHPGLYAGVFNSSDDTTDGYAGYPGQQYSGVAGVGAESAIPTYVSTLSNAEGTNGVDTSIPAWQVYFATPPDIANYGSGYAQLSVAMACDYGSNVVNLNGHQLIWSRANYSDCFIRSGLSGYTEWYVMEFPASDLNQTPGGSNEITISVTQEGLEDDAWRLELTNNTSNPATTGWNDYTYTSPSKTTAPNDAIPNP